MQTNSNTYVAVKDSDGSFSKMTETKFQNLIKETSAKNVTITAKNNALPAGSDLEPLAEIPVADRQQTFIKHVAETLEEAQTLCPDPKVLITYFNRGYGLAEEKFISDFITDEDSFTAVEGAFDLTPEVAKLPERTRTKKAASVEDMVASLKGLPQDQLKSIIEQFMAALG